MKNSVGPATVQFLEKFGYDPESISSFRSDTRVVQDLGLQGESLEDFFSLMSTEFGVNLGIIDLDDYSISEKHLLTRWWPHSILRNLIAGRSPFSRDEIRLKPITLAMVEATLLSKRKQF